MGEINEGVPSWAAMENPSSLLDEELSSMATLRSPVLLPVPFTHYSVSV